MADLTLSLPSEDVQYKDVPHTQMLYTKLSHTHTVTPMATPTHNMHTLPGTVGWTFPWYGWWVDRHYLPLSAAGPHGENPAICSN